MQLFFLWVQAPRDHVISLQFVGDFGVYCSYSSSCYHWVEVKYKADLGLEGPRYTFSSLS